jgi:hypothetical protein
MIAVGEAFTKICGDQVRYHAADQAPNPSDRLTTLVREQKLHICWAGHHGGGGGRRLTGTAERILSAAPGIGIADALIIACALMCPTTERLYTTEARLIQNPDLKTLVGRSRSRFMITEAP